MKPRRSFVSAAVVDVLGLDGGWLTIPGISLCIADSNEESIRTALLRLRRRGVVESRQVPLALGDSPYFGTESRLEWRLT